MSEEEEIYSIDCTLGTLHLEVEGCDEEWVQKTFREEWEERMEEAEGMERALRDGSRVHQ